MARFCWVPRLHSEEERLLRRLLKGTFTSMHLPISFLPTLKATDLAADNFKLDYNPALDGLRGVAILLVVLSHAHVPLFDGAFLGVDLFFVLSGFLITSSLLMEQHGNGRLQYWRFYRRRFFRLMPALALFLATYCLLAPLLWPDLDDVRQDALVSLLYLADYGIAFFDTPGTLLHMWSLSVEEHFYLVWPPLLALLLRFSRVGAVWRPLAVLYLLSWAWRVLWVVQGQQFYEIFFRFDTRASGLLAGCLLAALMLEKPAFIQWLQARVPYALWLALAVPLLMQLGWDNQGALVWGITVVELATLVVLVAVQQRTSLVYEMLSAPLLVRLGTLSYGIYLWHYPVVRYFRADYSWPVVVLLALPIATALAALSFYTLERWAMRYRDGRPVRPASLVTARHPVATAGAGMAGALR